MMDLITVDEHTFLLSVTPTSPGCELVEAWKKGTGQVLWGERHDDGLRLWDEAGQPVAEQPAGGPLSLRSDTDTVLAAAVEAICALLRAEQASGDGHDEAEAA